jgi:hypothetical protein
MTARRAAQDDDIRRETAQLLALCGCTDRDTPESRAFRELGRAIRTIIVLLRYLCPLRSPELLGPVVVQGLLDEEGHVVVLDDVDLPLALPAGRDQVGQAELGQVLADHGVGGTDGVGEAADVVLVVGQQPQQVQPGRGGQHRERLGGLVQHVRVRRLLRLTSPLDRPGGNRPGGI